MISDEKIVSALMSTNSVRQAAKTAGVSESTIYTKLRDRDFCKLLEGQQHAILVESVNAINAKIGEAIDALMDIMSDKETPPQTRIAAVDCFFRNSNALESKMIACRNRAIPSRSEELFEKTFEQTYRSMQ